MLIPRRHVLLLTLFATGAAHAGCPPQPPRVLLERFVAAPCVACWKEMPPLLQEHRDAWVLDWIVPPPPDTPPPATARRAFLRGAALSEATARMARLGTLATDEAFTLSHPLPQRSALDLLVDHTRTTQRQDGVAHGSALYRTAAAAGRAARLAGAGRAPAGR